MFVDRALFVAQAGRGGDGAISFRHEACAPRGGPDGGDGGDGGSVVVVASKRRPTLADVAHRPLYKATDGRPGRGRNRAGRSGKDLVIEVPRGTVVRDAEKKDEVVADLTEEGATLVLAHGGRGGKGNVRFATATAQAPRVASHGAPGERRSYVLELKLLAQVGLVGLPNAGKSTFLRRISRARPKVGAYPFTTLAPHLGVSTLDDDRELVVADLPGLIEGAHEGTGLGDEFLRHVERCRVLLHLVDGTGGPETGTKAPAEAYRIIRNELLAYDPGLATKPEVVALNKCDALSREAAALAARSLEEAAGKRVFQLSGVSGFGVDAVLGELAAIVAESERPEEAPRPSRTPPHLAYDLRAFEREDEAGAPPPRPSKKKKVRQKKKR